MVRHIGLGLNIYYIYVFKPLNLYFLPTFIHLEHKKGIKKVLICVNNVLLINNYIVF